MSDFRHPLLLYVFETCRGDDGIADEENISLGIRQGSKTIVILLSCGCQGDSNRLEQNEILEGRRRTDQQYRTIREYRGLLRS